LKASFVLQKHGANVDQGEAFLQLERQPSANRDASPAPPQGF